MCLGDLIIEPNSWTTESGRRLVRQNPCNHIARTVSLMTRETRRPVKCGVTTLDIVLMWTFHRSLTDLDRDSPTPRYERKFHSFLLSLPVLYLRGRSWQIAKIFSVLLTLYHKHSYLSLSIKSSGQKKPCEQLGSLTQSKLIQCLPRAWSRGKLRAVPCQRKLSPFLPRTEKVAPRISNGELGPWSLVIDCPVS